MFHWTAQTLVQSVMQCVKNPWSTCSVAFVLITWKLREFGLPPRCNCGFRCSRMFHDVGSYVVRGNFRTTYRASKMGTAGCRKASVPKHEVQDHRRATNFKVAFLTTFYATME